MQLVVLRLKADSNVNLVQKAVKMLNEAFSNVKPKVIFCLSDEGDFEIKFVSRRRMLALAGNPAGKDVLGFCDRDNRKIYILYDVNLQSDEAQLISTIMHEILHALGLEHLSEPYSLMYKEDVGVRGVTDYDVKALMQRLRRTNLKGGER
jgi:predicted Zn-dependent protease